MAIYEGPDRDHNQANISDFEYHGFIVEKKRSSAKTIVIASQVDSICVGSTITALNGTCVRSMTPTELRSLFRNRSAVLRPSESSVVS